MRRSLSIAAAALLVFAVAGPAQAGNPKASYEFSACWDGSHVVLRQTWNAIGVTDVSFGIGNDNGEGLGEVYTLRARSGDESSTLSPPDDSTQASGGLLFHGKLVREGSVHAPSAGWTALDAC
jgi:hypothetical protein